MLFVEEHAEYDDDAYPPLQVCDAKDEAPLLPHPSHSTRTVFFFLRGSRAGMWGVVWLGGWVGVVFDLIPIALECHFELTSIKFDRTLLSPDAVFHSLRNF